MPLHVDQTEQWRPDLAAAADYMCGVLAGMGKVVAGHPFDTIKGRVQAGHFPSPAVALRQTLAAEGPVALYQGVLPPLFTVCCVSGILFHANGRIRAALQPNDATPLTAAQMAVAGAGAGALTAFVLTPLDTVKIHLQVAARHRPVSPGSGCGGSFAFRGRAAAAVDRLGPAGLSRGFSLTLWREAITFGVFFPLNETFKRRLTSEPPPTGAVADLAAKGQADAPPLKLSARVLAAGTAGVLCWVPAYPLDRVKTAVQLAPPGTSRSSLRAAASIYRADGLRGFGAGITPCLLRAFPAYAAQFVAFDLLMGAKEKAMV